GDLRLPGDVTGRSLKLSGSGREVTRGPPDLGEDLLDGCVEGADRLSDSSGALGLEARHPLPLARQPLALAGIVAEDQNGARHGADLVGRPGRWDLGGRVAFGKPLHRLLETAERQRDRAPDEEIQDKSE